MSILTRISGDIAAGGFYVFGAAYATSVILGWHLDSVTIVDYVASLDPWLKMSVKATVALPVIYHSLNGTRYLIWDLLPKQLINNRSVIQT
jgi:succinate dehydrogenase (ubiquinone) cytochrome b560 subunit